MLALGLAFATGSAAAARPLGPPRLAVLAPVGPPDYAVLLDQLKGARVETFGPFSYRVGKIAGVPVVVSIAPMDGPLMRALAAQDMLVHYDIRAFIYPGTSGAHLGPDQMRVGDVVLGAANVDFGNFFMGKDGAVVGDEFGHEKSSSTHYGTLYADPDLLGAMACAATRVAAQTALPGWLNPHAPRARPDIFYFGVQGTSTMWLANPQMMAKTDAVFHEIDEDGDWYSNLAATIHHTPFIEVSVIADSILALPETQRGIPVPPDPAEPKASVLAQRLAYRIALDLIAHDGAAMLRGHYTTPTADPFPTGAFDHPKDPGRLMDRPGCAPAGVK